MGLKDAFVCFFAVRLKLMTVKIGIRTALTSWRGPLQNLDENVNQAGRKANKIERQSWADIRMN